MRWLSLQFNAECFHGLGDSVLPILQSLVFLALAGCSAKDEAAAPSQAPTIVAQPTVVVSGLGARVSATLNPNGIDTDWYFEYGPTEAYGRRLTSKHIHATLNDVVVSDTIANLGVDTTYHCRLVATNPTGTTHSADMSFAVAKEAPTILVETMGTVVGPKVVVVTATVNANNGWTDSYFEYGPTVSYGKRTVSRSIGMGGTGVVVRDTLRGLSFDSPYHCRIVADNAAGTTVGTDQTFICPSADWQDFAFPLAAGTTWHYTYYYRSWASSGNTLVNEISGSQVWRSTGSTVGNAIRINVTRIDTTRLWWWGTDTTTGISVTDTSFLVENSPDSLFVRWYDLSHFGWSSFALAGCHIPLVVDRATDSLAFSEGPYDHRWIATYVAHKGLVSYSFTHSSNYQWRERLTLESVSP